MVPEKADHEQGCRDGLHPFMTHPALQAVPDGGDIQVGQRHQATQGCGESAEFRLDPILYGVPHRSSLRLFGDRLKSGLETPVRPRLLADHQDSSNGRTPALCHHPTCFLEGLCQDLDRILVLAVAVTRQAGPDG